MNSIVALHGASNSGKDVIGNHLHKKYGFVILSFAGGIYQKMAEMFEVAVEFMKDRETKTKPCDRLAFFYSIDPHYRAYAALMKMDLWEPRTSRFHMETFNNWMKNKNEWAERVSAAIEATPQGIGVVVTDLRAYEDLREWRALQRVSQIHSRDLIVIEVVREGIGRLGYTADHPSKIRLPASCIDTTIFSYENDIPNTLVTVEDLLGLNDPFVSRF